jgi:hypothetical protein
VLNQPVELTTVKRRKQVTASSVEGATVNKAGSRVRILDESTVLPAEASFATVMLNQRTNARNYSPLAEFFVKSNLNWRRLNLAMLLLSISAVIMLIILMITQQGLFSSHRPVNTSAKSLPRPTETTAQVELTTSGSSESATIFDAQKEKSTPVASIPVAKPEGAIEAQKKFSKSANSELSQRVAADDAKLNIARKVLRQEAKSVASKAASASESSNRGPSAPQRHASMKEISKSATSPEKVHVDHPRSEILGSREASSSSTDEVGRSKAESKSAPATGGGQRPRRVTP